MSTSAGAFHHQVLCLPIHGKKELHHELYQCPQEALQSYLLLGQYHHEEERQI